jgi:hypothetical protein
LAKSASHSGKEFENEIVRIVQQFSQRGTGTNTPRGIQGGPSE